MINRNLLAIEYPVGPIGDRYNEGGLGPWARLWVETSVDPSANALSGIISNVISILTIVAGLWFVFNFVLGAVGIILGAGNDDAIKKNSQKITTSLIGFVIVIASYSLISLIGLILGFDVTDLTVAIRKIRP